MKEGALDRTMRRNRFRGGFGPVVRQNTEWMITAHLDNAIIIVVSHFDPVVAMVPRKMHSDDFDVLYCNVLQNI